MQDDAQTSTQSSGGVHPQAWIQDSIVGGILGLIALTVPYFVWLLVRVQSKVGLEGGRIWAFVIGFAIIELYLLLRVRHQIRKARSHYRVTRSRQISPSE